MIKRLVIIVLLLIAMFGSVFIYDAWRKYQASLFAQQFRIPPVTVSTVLAKEELWDEEIFAVGSLVSVNSVNVTSNSNGRVIGISFKSGQTVQEGQLLVQLDDELLTQSLADNRAQLILTKSNLDRSAQLRTKGAVAQTELDLNQSLYNRAKARVASDKINIKHKKVKAPFGGRIGIRKVNLGDFLEAGDTIASLNSIDPIFVDFMVPEKSLTKLKKGQKFAVTIDSYPNREFKGEVVALNSTVDVSSRNITVRGTIDNKNAELYPGVFTTVRLFTGTREKVIVVPQTAITYSTFGDVMYVVKSDGKKKRSPSNALSKSENVVVIMSPLAKA